MGVWPLVRITALALAAVALCAALAAPPAVASEEPAEASQPTTITTTLYPGWNMVGWVGPPAIVSDLYDSIPTLHQAWRWNAEQRQYEPLARTGAGSRIPILPGDALWLRVGGDAPVEWTRAVSDDGVLLELRAGRNFVAWTGRDGVSIEEALARFGDGLERVWQFDPTEQRYRLYHPAAATNSLTELKKGSTILVELSRDARWWQSGTAQTEFVYRGNVPVELQMSFTAEIEQIITFFAERYGITPPAFSIFLDSESPWLIASGPDIWLHTAYAHRPSVIAATYMSMFTSHLGYHMGPPFWPYWFTVGISRYAADLYVRERDGRTHDDIRAGRVANVWWHSPDPVDLSEKRWTHGPAPDGVLSVGALAVQWLVGHAAASARGDDFRPLEPGGLDPQGEGDAFVGYYRPQRPGSTWDDALESMFGITAEDFHGAFGEYLFALIGSTWPHLRDNWSTPAVFYLEDVPYQKQDEIDALLRDTETFFRERFVAGGADYTLIVGTQEGTPLREAYRLLWGKDLDHGLCETNREYVYIAALECLHDSQVVWRYQQVLLQQLIPWGPDGTPRTDDGRDPRGPRWFSVGVAQYLSGVHPLITPETDWSGAVHQARWTALPLSSMETYASEEAVPERAAFDSLSFLALWWLTERAGDPAIFDYYRRLPESETWEEAFEAAFGITVDDFYEEFEAYRSRVAPPN